MLMCRVCENKFKNGSELKAHFRAQHPSEWSKVHRMPIDDEKEKWSRESGHVAESKAGHIAYYNCWHCKVCDTELERMCGCGKLFDSHSFDEYIGCVDKEMSQVCPNGCKDIGGTKEFAK